jgi:predicted DNA-binding protein (MmcQ/YjbR family)
MDRKQYEAYLIEFYGITPDHPFEDDDDTVVFRHADNKKWFALVMNIPAARLGLGDGRIDVVNLKCDQEIITSLWDGEGIFPAYHMNKAHWISVVLDGRVDSHTLEWLTKISYGLTAKKMAKKI